jgi:hypothetical protein
VEDIKWHQAAKINWRQERNALPILRDALDRTCRKSRFGQVQSEASGVPTMLPLGHGVHPRERQSSSLNGEKVGLTEAACTAAEALRCRARADLDID